MPLKNKLKPKQKSEETFQNKRKHESSNFNASIFFVCKMIILIKIIKNKKKNIYRKWNQRYKIIISFCSSKEREKKRNQRKQQQQQKKWENI